MDLFNTPNDSLDIELENTRIRNSWKPYFEKLGKYKEFSEIVDKWGSVIPVMLDKMKKLILSVSAPHAAPPEWFVTISFKDELVKPGKIPEYMSKVIKKKWIKEYIYTIEQRSEEDNIYYGYHVHMLVTPNKYVSKSDVIREIYSTVKKYVEGKNYIDIEKVNHRNNIIKYMKGEKSEMKMKKCENDKPFREKYELEELYSA